MCLRRKLLLHKVCHLPALCGRREHGLVGQ